MTVSASGYKPKDVSAQSKQLQKLFPGLSLHTGNFKVRHMNVPEGADGLFVIPNWRSFAKQHYFSTYVDVVKIVFAKLRETTHGGNFRFENYREEHMTSAYLCETAEKARAMARVADQQRFSELLVIPAQISAVHHGHSVKEARAAIGDNGFGLGVFEVGIILLTHPERITDDKDLPISCIGDEFKLGGKYFDEDRPYVPSFRSNVGKLSFNVGDCHYTVGGRYISASGFITK